MRTQWIVAHNEELDMFTYGHVPADTPIMPGTLCTVTHWPALGIKVTRYFKVDASPPKLVSRLVDYDG